MDAIIIILIIASIFGRISESSKKKNPDVNKENEKVAPKPRQGPGPREKPRVRISDIEEINRLKDQLESRIKSLETKANNIPKDLSQSMVRDSDEIKQSSINANAEKLYHIDDDLVLEEVHSVNESLSSKHKKTDNPYAIKELKDLGGDKKELRKLVLYKEIFDQPLSLRKPRY